MQPVHKISVSILSADFARLEEEVNMINESEAHWIHVDVMDGVFVPNISLGLPVVGAIKKHAKKPLDVHLMIVHPSRYVEDFCHAGADMISIHSEADYHLHRTIEHIKKMSCNASVALNPHTPINAIENVMDMLDMVCLMSVNPGFGGQKFIENTYTKIKKIKDMRDAQNINTYIQVDGGVNNENAPRIIASGADVLVAGSAIFNHDKPKSMITKLCSSHIPI